MADTTNTILRMVDKQIFQSEVILNVYHYLFDGGVIVNPDITDFIGEFEQLVVTGVRAAQSDNLVHTELRCTQLNNGSGEGILGVNLPGQRPTANDAPTWVAASYQLNRFNRDVRNGRKSIAGLDESDFVGNDLSASGLVIFEPIAPIFDALITTVDGIWEPIILGKQDTVNPNAYNVGSIRSVSLRTTLRSQVSRIG